MAAVSLFWYTNMAAVMSCENALFVQDGMIFLILNRNVSQFRSGMLDYDLALDLTPYLVNEKDYVPWMSALNNLAYIATQFSTLDSENNENTHYYLAYKVQ